MNNTIRNFAIIVRPVVQNKVGFSIGMDTPIKMRNIQRSDIVLNMTCINGVWQYIQ